MVTGTLKSSVNKLWEEFWTGGITNPITVIEQISFLMFAKLLDIKESNNEKKAAKIKNVKMIIQLKLQPECFVRQISPCCNTERENT